MNRAIAAFSFVCLLSVPAMAQQDTSVQLLQEVRLLRQAIESLVATGSRVQIVFGRLQLQEQRTATAVRRLDELRETLARVTRQASDTASQAQDFEESLRDYRAKPNEPSREEMDNMLRARKREAAEIEAERQRLQNEEALAASALATEQARWAELNQQLEDLERALAKKPQ